MKSMAVQYVQDMVQECNPLLTAQCRLFPSYTDKYVKQTIHYHLVLIL